MRKLMISIMLPFCYLFSIGQNTTVDPGALPSIVPPSPEVSSLAKVGSLSAGLHTGAANVSIPLYELAVGSLKIPISLSYSTNGTRVNDISSRVGLGWNLVAGGNINRVIHDEEDDGALTIQMAPPNYGLHDQQLLDYVSMANFEHYDTEKDEYSFSVNGISGKFYFDDVGYVRIADHSNVKILKNGNTFTLTTGDGTTYTFGGTVIEKTRDIKTNGNPRAHKIKATTWFLTKIESIQGDVINFGYTPIYTKAQMGAYQSVTLKTNDPLYPYMPSGYDPCLGLCEGQISPVGWSRVDYDTYYLSNISTSNGQQVYFIYQDRPDDSGDNRLVNILVNTTNATDVARAVRKYQLEYQDHPVANDLNQRFLLTKLYTQSIGTENPPEVLVHQFDYNDPSSLPSQESLNQDYYGFSKGNGSNPTNFFPYPIAQYSGYLGANQGADRSPDFTKTKAGTLQKVTYPTSGYEEFVYEPHTILQNVTDSVFPYTRFISGVGLNFNSVNTYTQTFTPTAAPIRVFHTTEWNASGPTPGAPNYYTPDDIHFLSYLEIWKVSTNEMVFESRHKNYEGTNSYPHLQAGEQYQLKLKVVGNSHHSYATIYYNPTIQTTYVNTPACGIRVQKINSHDPVSNQTTSKYYKYASLTSLDHSSGVGVVRPSFETAYQGGGICYPNGSYIPGQAATGEYLMQCPGGLVQINSSAISGGFTFNGSPVAYNYVIESDDMLFANGGIQHQFYTYHNPNQPISLLNEPIPGASTQGVFPEENGTELKTTIFKKQNSNLITLKETSNEYSGDNRIGFTHTSYTTRKRWNPPGQSNWSFTDRLKGFDIAGYIYLSGWRHLDKTTTIEYDQNGQNPITNIVTYDYASISHLQPTQVTTLNSKQEQVIQQFKYPADIPDPVHTSMIAKHIITPVIEATTNNGSAVSVIQTPYAGWNSNSFFKPNVVKSSKAGGTLQDLLIYHNYDSKGNALEVSRKNDMPISYLWNYHQTYPVAEVKNASHGKIGYTSFEGDNKGGWDFALAGIQNGGITGEKSFTGSLVFNSDPGLQYTVTVWSQSAGITVNYASGTHLMSKNGWSLYEWNISNSNEINVTGTNIDEVRAYPVNSLMTTYTYMPFTGVSSVCDMNNNIQYYEYDGLGRLIRVRDIERNILKQYEYKFNQPIVPCSNSTANWQPTGIKKCVMTPNGNYTGEQRKEERDNNNCSVTYLQTRWVSLGTTGQCQPVPDCDGHTNPQKRVVNGVCELGTRILVSSVNYGTYSHCTYKYQWSDGFESSTWMETTQGYCPLDL